MEKKKEEERCLLYKKQNLLQSIQETQSIWFVVGCCCCCYCCLCYCGCFFPSSNLFCSFFSIVSSNQPDIRRFLEENKDICTKEDAHSLLLSSLDAQIKRRFFLPPLFFIFVSFLSICSFLSLISSSLFQKRDGRRGGFVKKQKDRN